MPGLGRDETVERTDLSFLHQLADFVLLHFPPAHDLVNHELAVLRLVAAEGLDHGLAVGRRNDVRFARVGVVLLEFLDPFDDSLGDVDDLRHEVVTREFPVLHLAQLVFPFAGDVRLGEDLRFDGAEKLDQRFRLGRRNELALTALDVFLIDQAIDRIRAGRRSAQAAFFHRSASSSSSTSFPAPSIAESSVASV